MPVYLCVSGAETDKILGSGISITDLAYLWPASVGDLSGFVRYVDGNAQALAASCQRTPSRRVRDTVPFVSAGASYRFWRDE